MSDDLGRAPDGTGLSQAEPQEGLGPSGFDPSREQLTEAETQVYFLLRKYRVQKHYRASSAAKVTRYAVYVHGEGQITEPAPNAEARAQADCLTAKAIVAILARDRTK